MTALTEAICTGKCVDGTVRSYGNHRFCYVPPCCFQKICRRDRSIDKLYLFSTSNVGWSFRSAFPPKERRFRVFAHIINETDEHYDIELVFPELLTIRCGPTVPCRFYRFFKIDKSIHIFDFPVQNLEQLYHSSISPIEGSGSRWITMEKVEKNAECPVCLESKANLLLNCGHRICQTCPLSMENKCPICRKEKIFESTYII